MRHGHNTIEVSVFFLLGYYAIGSACVQCDDLPVTAFVAAVFFLLVVGSVAYNGFTVSIYTKVSNLTEIIQYIGRHHTSGIFLSVLFSNTVPSM